MIHTCDEGDSVEGMSSSARRCASSSRRHDGAGNDGETSCAICYIIGFLFCLVEMKPKTKIILTWFYTIICACVIGSLMAGYNHSNVLTASPTDMRKLDISTTFCESVTVKSSAAITTYKFYSEPEIGNGYTEIYHRVSTRLGWNEYQYWGYYLLKGSVITAHVCGQVYLYRIVGKENLDNWLEGSHEDSSDGGPILTKTCRSLRRLYYSTTVNETASNSEQYYFLFINTRLSNGPAINVKVDFQIRRKYYNVYGNVSTLFCDSTECTVPLSVQSSESVVIYVPDNIMTSDTTVTSHCKPRVYMYILVFGILPFLIGTLITCAILKCSRKHSSDTDGPRSSIFTVTNNENERLQGYINENFLLQMSPPSYDEVQALSSSSYNEAPPSYDEAPPSYNESPPCYDGAVCNNNGNELSATRST